MHMDSYTHGVTHTGPHVQAILISYLNVYIYIYIYDVHIYVYIYLYVI